MRISISQENKLSLLTNNGIPKALEFIKSKLAGKTSFTDEQWVDLIIGSVKTDKVLVLSKALDMTLADNIILMDKRLTVHFGEFTFLIEL